MKYRTIAIHGVALLALGRSAAAQCPNMPPGTERQTMQSTYMGDEEPFVVYLPPDYATGTRRYPVVYWFHGRGDNECTQLPLATNIQAAIKSGAVPPMIYVFLNGGSGCNFDDTTCPGKMVESFVLKELIPHIDATYRTIPGPAGRSIEGFSMGAESVLRYFSKYADQFCDAVSYAPIGGSALSQMAQDTIKAKGKVVFRLVVGTADSVHLPGCRSYEKMLVAINLPHEYQEVPGVNHNPFALWGAMGGMVGVAGLQVHARCFAGAAAADGSAPAAAGKDAMDAQDDATPTVTIDAMPAPSSPDASAPVIVRTDAAVPGIVPSRPRAAHGCAYASNAKGPSPIAALAFAVIGARLARRRR